MGSLAAAMRRSDVVILKRWVKKPTLSTEYIRLDEFIIQ